MEKKMTGWRKKQIAKSVESDNSEWSISQQPNADWTYKWNDNVVSFEDYKKLVADHEDFVKQMEQKKMEENKPVRKTKGKK
jgi:predicted RNA-binding protein with EMAP domain